MSQHKTKSLRREPSLEQHDDADAYASSNPVHYITDNLLVTALPQRTRQTEYGDNSNQDEGSSGQQIRNAPVNAQQKRTGDDDNALFHQRLNALQQFLHTATAQKNATQFVLVSLAADPNIDPQVVEAMNGQVVTLPWHAAGAPASELPTLGSLLDICYALQALLQWTPAATTNPTTVSVILACENGQTRTGLAAAAYLRYINAVPCTRDGFLHVLVQTVLRHVADSVHPRPVFDALPPSVRTLLYNWDQILAWQTWLQPRPLLLRAVTIQGIPVEDQPRLDIYDRAANGENENDSQRHVYSSHAWLRPGSSAGVLEDDNDDLNSDNQDPSVANMSVLTWSSQPQQQQQFLRQQQRQRYKQHIVESPWVDDEGFYKVNQWVAGDFCVLCRFGGVHAHNDDKHDEANDDTTKLLFRYTHTTAVLPAGGPLECPVSAVDIMPRYQPFLDPHDFLLTLVFDDPWASGVDNPPPVWTPPPLVFGAAALEQGCRIVTQHHVLQPPVANDLVPSAHPALSTCPANILGLLWQLSAGEWTVVAERWQGLVQRYQAQQALHARALQTPRKGHHDSHSPAATVEQTQAILDIVDHVDGIPDDDTQKQRDVISDAASVPETPVKANPDKLHSIGQHHHQCPGVSLQWRSTILQAHAGDVPVALGLRGHAYDWVHRIQQTDPLPSPAGHPRVPLLPLRQSDRLPPLAPLDDPANAAAVDLFLQIQHAGVTLEDLQELATRNVQGVPEPPLQAEKDKEKQVAAEQGNPNEARYGEEEKKAEGKDESAATPKESYAPQGIPEEEPKTNAETDEHDNPPMKKDLRFAKYWKMKSVGLPEGAIKQAMTQDGVDVSVWDFDWERSYDEQTAHGDVADDAAADKVPMNRDPRFEKYWKMKSVGLPEGAVKQAMTKDGVDETVWDLDWERNYEEQTAPRGETSGPPMRKDPRFEKYWKMKNVGLPEGAIKNAMLKDSVDASIWDLDWDRNYEEQTTPPLSTSSGPPMKDDPRFQKYWKMKNVGLPEGAIRNAMAKDNVDESVWNLDWDKNYEEQTASLGGGAANGPPMKDDPRFQKYWKMKNVGLPEGAIKNAMTKDGVDEAAWDLNWDKNYEVQTASVGNTARDGPPMKDDPQFTKYWKMKTVGLPEGAIRNAMTKDGLDPSLFDLDWEKSLVSQQGASAEADTDPPLRDDPEFQKYFRMLSMGLPPGAVKNAMSRDGKDPSVIDLDPNRSLASQNEKTPNKAQRRGSIVPQKRVRRKKIFWKPLDPNQIKENSLWSLVKGKVSMSHLNYDVKEFEDLFTESADPADKKKMKKSKSSAAAAKKKAVQVIDGKRSMNGGIILLRLKMDYGKIADLVDEMEQGQLDATQLLGLKEYLPTQEERSRLEAYMAKGKTEEETAKAYADLSECEKYMWTMRQVEDANSKFDCMIFKAQFRTRADDLLASIRVIEQACDEVKTSEKLRKVFAMILTLVNTINTGGEDKGVAEGFNLEALVKLNEAKAFDKKTSVLQYLVKLVRQNDEGLLNFHKELKHVGEAQNLMIDMLGGDIKKLSEDLEGIREAVTRAAESAESKGERKFRLEDLREQKTLLRTNGTVLQFNKVDHLTGRTPMERFFLRASNEINGLVALSDDVKSKYESLLEFFGENLDMPSNEFFGTMKKFINEFIVSEVQVEKQEKARQKERRRNETKAKAAEEKAKTAAKDVRPAEAASTANEKSTPSTHPLEKNGLHPICDFADGKAGIGRSSDADPLAKMQNSRQHSSGDLVANEMAKTTAHPVAVMPAAGNQSSSDNNKTAPHETVDNPKNKEVSTAHPVAAMLATRDQSSSNYKSAPSETDDIPENKEEKETPSSTAHPVAAMLAERNQSSSDNKTAPKETEDIPDDKEEKETPSSTAHPVAAMLAKRNQSSSDNMTAPNETVDILDVKEEKEAPSSTAHPVVAVLAARLGVLEDSEESRGPSLTTHSLAAMLSTQQGFADVPEDMDGHKESSSAMSCQDSDRNEEEPSEPQCESPSAAHPLAAMLSARNNGAGDPPVSNDDEASNDTVDVAEDDGKAINLNGNHQASTGNIQEIPRVVEAVSSFDPDSSHASKDNEHGVALERVENAPRSNINAWLAEVMKVRDALPSRPFGHQRSDDTDSTGIGLSKDSDDTADAATRGSKFPLNGGCG